MNRRLWIFGLLLLVGSIVGASLAFNHSPTFFGTQRSNAAPASSAADQPPLVLAVGFVDGKAGVSRLYPVQPGRVVKVLAEDTEVKKGDTILWLDEETARLKVDEAKADLDNAVAQVRQASLLKGQLALKFEQQQSAIAAAQHKRQAAESERLSKERTATSAGVDVNANLLEAMKQNVAQLDELIKVEQSRLRELKLQDPELEMNRARANEAAKKVQLDQAEWLLKQCRLAAPEDGRVLRTHVNAGEMLGPNPTRPAVEFLAKGPLIVRAEVIQEWAHRIKVNQEAEVVDDTFLGPSWKGKISFVAPWFAQKRNLIIEPFTYNDVRYMECVVEILDQGDYPLRVGQRVRVKIKAP